MNCENYFKKLRVTIDKALDKYLPSEKKEPKELHKAMRYSVFSGGKRIRPILAVESSKVCGGGLEKIVPAACAIEYVHTYSLIHDDLPSMDDDDYRRGLPSCHKAFGEANAILAGDALVTLAFSVISKNLDSDTGMNAVRELSDAIGTKGVVGGQAIDLRYQDKNKDRKTTNLINRLKTSKLFEASASLGAIVAKSPAKKIKAMANFGSFLGMAFQVIDDILDNGDYVRAFGKSSALRDSKVFIAKAKSELSIFGDKADNLRDMADYILTRLDGKTDR